MDEELLQDFLVEAGELIENIDERLVALESTPDDADILNEVFRAFHTIKGGAGFLSLEPLVAVCHRAEDVLNLIRGGQRQLDAHSTDLVLRSVDEVRRMFEQVGAGESPQPAPQALLDGLEALLDAPTGANPSDGEGPDASIGGAPTAEVPEGAEAPAQNDGAAAASPSPDSAGHIASTGGQAATAGIDEIEDFDALIDAIREGGTAEASAAPAEPQPLSAVNEPTSVASAAGKTKPSETTATSKAEADDSSSCATSHAGSSASGTKRREQSLRVDAGRVDGVMNLVGELVLVRNRLSALSGRVEDEEVNQALSRLELVTSDLQASVTGLRMQPIGKAFGRFPRVVRDLARQLGKQVTLEMHGESTELDKGMVEGLGDPLVHLVRNAVDHGIESPAEREQAGKPASGRLVLSAEQQGSHIFVKVTDDGAGLDAEVIRRKAVDKGVIDTRMALQMSDSEALQLVFMPGFSTRSQVSDVSGRGVGMDVVKSHINKINGSVDIQSEKGSGTEILVRLPLTLAILPTLMVVVAGRRFAMPLPMIEEIVDFDGRVCSMMDGETVLSLRETILPLLDLTRWTGPSESDSDVASSAFVVVVNTGDRRIGMVVDQLIGQEDVIIKPLGSRLEGLPGFSGATITGDGGIALIIDPASLFSAWRHVAVHDAARFVA